MTIKQRLGEWLYLFGLSLAADGAAMFMGVPRREAQRALARVMRKLYEAEYRRPRPVTQDQLRAMWEAKLRGE